LRVPRPAGAERHVPAARRRAGGRADVPGRRRGRGLPGRDLVTAHGHAPRARRRRRSRPGRPRCVRRGRGGRQRLGHDHAAGLRRLVHAGRELMPGRALMRAGVWRLWLAALAAALLAGCAGTAPAPGLAVSSVAAAGADGSFVVDGTGFVQYRSGRGMLVEACALTVDAELVVAEPTEATLPPAGLVTIEVAGRRA